MGAWYEGDGTLELRDVPEMREVLSRFEELAMEADEPVQFDEKEVVPGVVRVFLHWHGHCSHSHISEIDGVLGELVPYNASHKALEFKYRYDDAHEEMYLGSGEEIAKAKSEHALTVITQFAPDLLPAQVAEARLLFKEA
jgi:hypothetical protein